MIVNLERHWIMHNKRSCRGRSWNKLKPNVSEWWDGALGAKWFEKDPDSRNRVVWPKARWLNGVFRTVNVRKCKTLVQETQEGYWKPDHGDMLRSLNPFYKHENWYCWLEIVLLMIKTGYKSIWMIFVSQMRLPLIGLVQVDKLHIYRGLTSAPRIRHILALGTLENLCEPLATQSGASGWFLQILSIKAYILGECEWIVLK